MGLLLKLDYKDKDRKGRFTRRYFTEDEVKIIATMNSNSVASKYRCSKTIATDMIKNAKRILGYKVPSRDIYYNFTCHFNKGKTVDDVAKIYPELPRGIIEKNYESWDINTNIDNNKEVLNKWNSIIESGDLGSMIDGFFDHTIKGFAKEEECTVSLADDIMAKLYDVLCRNPFVCAGFGKYSFDKDALVNIVSDAINRGYVEDQVTENLYNMTCNLYNIYVETYDYHSDILAGTHPIPDSIGELERDSFMSLIWNRFNRRIIYGKERNLSSAQKIALESEPAKRVALLFMVNYDRACNIISSHRKRIK